MAAVEEARGAGFAVATDRAYWRMVSSHLSSSAPLMMATHGRNQDDAAGVAVFENPPKTSDRVESCFAALDQTPSLGAGARALFGAASSHMPKAFDTTAAKRQKAGTATRKKCRGSGTDAT